MKRVFPYVCVLACAYNQAAMNDPLSLNVDESEIAAIEQLIQTTERQLALQKELKKLMQEFQQQKKRFAAGDESKAHTLEMVKTADQILQWISMHHLRQIFSADYLEELAFFSSIATKKVPHE